MGVTAIKYFLNQSGHTVEIHNHQNHRRYTGIAPGQSRSMDEWIPWATSPAEFDRGAHLEIRQMMTGQEDPVFAIWQRTVAGDGDFVRFSQRREVPGWDNPGQHVPGAARANGNRVLRLLENNTLLLEWAG